jgi:hypothetical protein
MSCKKYGKQNLRMDSKEVCVLTTGDCEYVILWGKGDFADVHTLRWKIILDLLGVSNLIYKNL